MTRRLAFACALALFPLIASCKSKPASVDDIASRAKDHMTDLDTLRKNLAADGVRAVGYKSVTGASGMACGNTKGRGAGEWQCSMPASASKKTVTWDDVPALVGMSDARYKSYLKLLDAVKAEDATVEPSGVLVVYVVSQPAVQRGLTWCPGPPSDHAVKCHRASRKYTAIDEAWYAWE